MNGKVLIIIGIIVGIVIIGIILHFGASYLIPLFKQMHEIGGM